MSPRIKHFQVRTLAHTCAGRVGRNARQKHPLGPESRRLRRRAAPDLPPGGRIATVASRTAVGGVEG
jgi:hypothetical protein